MARRPPRPPRRTIRRVALSLTFGALLFAAGCDRSASDEPQPADDSPDPGADTYTAAIASVVDVPDDPADEPPDPLPVVYIVPIDRALGIEAQAAVIDSFATSHDLRFVDELAAAVDADAPGHPPRDDAIVLAVGRVDPEPPHLLRIERYHSDTDVDATLLTLAYVVDHWVVITAEPVPPEALTDAE